MEDYIISTLTKPLASADQGDLAICLRDATKTIQLGCGTGNSSTLNVDRNNVSVFGDLDVSGRINNVSLVNGHITTAGSVTTQGNVSGASVIVDGHNLFANGRFNIPNANVDARHLASQAVTSGAIRESNVLGRHIANNNVQRAHLQDKAVNQDKIDDLAIYREHLQPKCVSTDKLADTCVTLDKLSSGLRIPALNIADGNVFADKLANQAVIEAKIADSNVTSVKIANRNVLSRHVALDAIVSELIADGNVTETKIADSNVTERKLRDQCVTASKLADACVKNGKIEDHAISMNKLADGAVAMPKIQDKAVTGDKIADASVVERNIADSNVTERKLRDLCVTEAKIADLNVTERKLRDQCVTSSKLALASVKNDKIEDYAISMNKLADGAVTTPKIQDKAVTGDKIADASLFESNIADSNVTERKLRDLCVTEAKLADSNVTERKLADSNVTETKLADSNVTERKLRDLCVTEVKLGDSAVVSRVIMDGAVTAPKIADRNVTNAKIALNNITSDLLASNLILKGWVDVSDGNLRFGQDAEIAVEHLTSNVYQRINAPDHSYVLQVRGRDRLLANDNMTELLGPACVTGSTIQVSETFDANPRNPSSYFGDYVARPIYTEFTKSGGFAVSMDTRISSASLEVSYKNLGNNVYSTGSPSWVTLFLYDSTCPTSTSLPETSLGGYHIVFYTSGRVVIYRNGGTPIYDQLVTALKNLPTCRVSVVCVWRRKTISVFVDGLSGTPRTEVVKYVDTTSTSTWRAPIGKFFGCFFGTVTTDPRLHGVSSYTLGGEKLQMYIDNEASNVFAQGIDVANDLCMDGKRVLNHTCDLSNIASLCVTGPTCLKDNVFGLSTGNELRGVTRVVGDLTNEGNCEVTGTLRAQQKATFESNVAFRSTGSTYTVFGLASNVVYGDTTFVGAVQATKTLEVRKDAQSNVYWDCSNNKVNGVTTFYDDVFFTDIVTASNVRANQLSVLGTGTTTTTTFKYPNNTIAGDTSNMGSMYVDDSLTINNNLVFSSNDTIWKTSGSEALYQVSVQRAGTQKTMIELDVASNAIRARCGKFFVDGTLVLSSTLSDTQGIALFNNPLTSAECGGIETTGKIAFRNKTDQVSRFTHDTVSGATVVTGIVQASALKCDKGATATPLDPVLDAYTFFGSPSNRIVGNTTFKGYVDVAGVFTASSNATFSSIVNIQQSTFGATWGNKIDGNTSVTGSFCNVGTSWFRDAMVVTSNVTAKQLIVDRSGTADTFFGECNVINGPTSNMGTLYVGAAALFNGPITLPGTPGVLNSTSQKTVFGSNNTNTIAGDLEIVGDTLVAGNLVVCDKFHMGSTREHGIAYDVNGISLFTSGTFDVQRKDAVTGVTQSVMNLNMQTKTLNCSNLAASNLATGSITGTVDGLTVKSGLNNDVVLRLQPNNGRNIAFYSKGAYANEFGVMDAVNSNWLKVTYATGAKPYAAVRGHIDILDDGCLYVKGQPVITSDYRLTNISQIELNKILYKEVYHGRVPMHNDQIQPQMTQATFLSVLKWNAASLVANYGSGKLLNRLSSNDFISDSTTGGSYFKAPAPGLWFVRVFVKFSDPYVNGTLALLKNTSGSTLPTDQSKQLARDFIPSGANMASISTYAYLQTNDSVTVLLSTTDLSLGSFTIVSSESYIDLTLLYPHS